MAKETNIARESKVSPGNAVKGGMARKIPRSDRTFYDDSFVTVYNDKGEIVERGIWDESVYRDVRMVWNERDGNYDIGHGYKLVVRND